MVGRWSRISMSITTFCAEGHESQHSEDLPVITLKRPVFLVVSFVPITWLRAPGLSPDATLPAPLLCGLWFAVTGKAPAETVLHWKYFSVFVDQSFEPFCSVGPMVYFDSVSLSPGNVHSMRAGRFCMCFPQLLIKSEWRRSSRLRVSYLFIF